MKNFLPNMIGVIHFPPLPGCEHSPGIEKALENSLQDLRAFEAGGMNGIIIENNYDLPHRIQVLPETVDAFKVLGEEIRKKTRLRLGVCVLWNDYRAALSIAKHINADFVRIPTMVDEVQTEYGISKPCAKDALQFRTEIDAEHIAILADVHVKHSKLLSSMNLGESTEMAVNQGAEGIIITGKWTGDSPALDDLRCAKMYAQGKQVFAGSGVSPENIKEVLSEANGVIVSTSLKESGHGEHRQNIVDWSKRVSEEKVRNLILASLKS
jgi:uncharacterized protein